MSSSSSASSSSVSAAVIKKIKVDHPVVDLDGDEMTRIIWQVIKDKVGVVIHNLSVYPIVVVTMRPLASVAHFALSRTRD